MTKAELQALLDEAACYSCHGNGAQAVTNALLRRWLVSLDAGADTTVGGLLESAGCLNCASGNTGEQLEIALLAAITEA